jgi:hypothetical protein
MKKEVLIAIILGFGLGLIITFGVWKANKTLQKQTQAPSPTPTSLPSPAETATPTPEALMLEISSPADNAISQEEKINLEGQSLPQTIIVIFYEEGEKILEADEEGKFTTDITLTGGANEILVKAFDQQGNETEKSLNIVYSTAEI